VAERRRRAGLKEGKSRARWGPSAATAGGDYGVPARRRGWLPWVLLAVLLLILAPIGYFGFGLASTLLAVSDTSPQGGSTVGGQLPPGNVSGTVYILAMGSDERRDKDGKVISGEVPHADTMILLAIDTDRHEIRMLSAPRDLLVDIPGYGKDHRINEAYTIGQTKKLPGGGAVLSVKTVEKLTGIKIPFYVVTTFDGFKQAVDAVGGVTVDVDQPISDHDYPGQNSDFLPIYVSAGVQLMNGDRSLWYVRSRHDDPLSDFGRNKRQQKFMTAFTRKLLKPDRLTQINQFEAIAKSNISTNMTPGQLVALGNAMLAMKKGGIKHYAVGPSMVNEPTASQRVAFGAVLIPDTAAINRLIRAFQNGDPSPGEPAPRASPTS
jgi:LCP family protein required for cell wall assembly